MYVCEFYLNFLNVCVCVHTHNSSGASGKEPTYLCGRQETWVPVFLPGESRGQRSLAGYSYSP